MNRVDAQKALSDSRPPKTEFSKRFVEFIQARLDKQVQACVLFNVVMYQSKNNTLRTDRPVAEKRDKMPRQYFLNRERALMMNESDDQILQQMVDYKTANSLDMDEEAQQWFDFITKGEIGAEVAKRLRN